MAQKRPKTRKRDAWQIKLNIFQYTGNEVNGTMIHILFWFNFHMLLDTSYIRNFQQMTLKGFSSRFLSLFHLKMYSKWNMYNVHLHRKFPYSCISFSSLAEAHSVTALGISRKKERLIEWNLFLHAMDYDILFALVAFYRSHLCSLFCCVLFFRKDYWADGGWFGEMSCMKI